MLMAGALLLLPACVYPTGYMAEDPLAGANSSVSWTSARYDADGFPIFGYVYGRPVYGYSSGGVAIYTVGGLYAGCYVPNWGPASWCRRHYRYPVGIYRSHWYPTHYRHRHYGGIHIGGGRHHGHHGHRGSGFRANIGGISIGGGHRHRR